jgi:hypothetical protein
MTMNTTTTNTISAFESSVANVSNNERAFRAALGLGLLTKILAGVIMSPAVMFSLTAVSVYLGMTAIMGVDPFYAVFKTITKAIATPAPAALAS